MTSKEKRKTISELEVITIAWRFRIVSGRTDLPSQSFVQSCSEIAHKLSFVQSYSHKVFEIFLSQASWIFLLVQVTHTIWFSFVKFQNRRHHIKLQFLVNSSSLVWLASSLFRIPSHGSLEKNHTIQNPLKSQKTKIEKRHLQNSLSQIPNHSRRRLQPSPNPCCRPLHSLWLTKPPFPSATWPPSPPCEGDLGRATRVATVTSPFHPCHRSLL